MDLRDLEKIQRVDAPPYLYTRIQQRIEQTKKETMPKGVVLTLAFCFAVIVVINAMVFLNYRIQPNPTENLVQSFQLSASNSLYQ